MWQWIPIFERTRFIYSELSAAGEALAPTATRGGARPLHGQFL